MMTSRPLRGLVNDAIASNEVLSKLQVPSKQKLRAGAAFAQLKKGTVIWHEQAPAVRFSLVLRGEVKLVKYSTKGAALLMDLVLPNQLFGAVYHAHDPVYTCTAVVVKPTELLSFHRKDLMEDLENNPALQRMLLADTCYKLCHAHQMRALWLEQIPVRIAHLLLHLYEKFGRVIPETRATIAELTGTSVETAIRITNGLARRGILATRRGQVEVLSLAGLRACAQGGGPALGAGHRTQVTTLAGYHAEPPGTRLL